MYSDLIRIISHLIKWSMHNQVCYKENICMNQLCFFFVFFFTMEVFNVTNYKLTNSRQKVNKWTHSNLLVSIIKTIKSNQIKSNQIKSNQIKSNQIKSNKQDGETRVACLMPWSYTLFALPRRFSIPNVAPLC